MAAGATVDLIGRDNKGQYSATHKVVLIVDYENKTVSTVVVDYNGGIRVVQVEPYDVRTP